MEVPLTESPHKILKERPEAPRTDSFWHNVRNPRAFVEEDPQQAISAVREAIRSGVAHWAVDESLEHILNAAKNDTDSVLGALGTGESKRVAMKVIPRLKRDHEIKDAELAKKMANVLAQIKGDQGTIALAKLLSHVKNEDALKEILKKHGSRIVSHPGSLKKVVTEPQLLKAILELEFHGNMNPKQLKIIRDAVKKSGTPELQLDIMLNTLEKDVRTKPAAEKTAILIGDVLKNAAATKLSKNTVKLLEKMETHVFSENGPDKEFGARLLHVAGESAALAYKNVARQMEKDGDYAAAEKYLKKAFWLIKEHAKHSGPKELERIHELIEDGSNPRAYVQQRATTTVNALVQLINPKTSGWSEHTLEAQEHNIQQALRAVQYMNSSGLLGQAREDTLKNLGRILTKLPEERVAEILPELAKSEAGIKLTSAYIAALEDHRAKYAVNKIIATLEQQGVPKERIGDVLRRIGYLNKIPAWARRQYLGRP